MSLGIRVARRACCEARLASSITLTRNASAASCKASKALPWNLRSFLKSCAISRTNLPKIRKNYDCLLLRIYQTVYYLHANEATASVVVFQRRTIQQNLQSYTYRKKGLFLIMSLHDFCDAMISFSHLVNGLRLGSRLFRAGRVVVDFDFFPLLLLKLRFAAFTFLWATDCCRRTRFCLALNLSTIVLQIWLLLTT